MFERFRGKNNKESLEDADRMPYVLHLRDSIAGKVTLEEAGFDWIGRYTPHEREEVNWLLLKLHEGTPLSADPVFEEEEARVHDYLASYFGEDAIMPRTLPLIPPPQVIE